MVEHKPWLGDHYSCGIEGQRIGVILYSHYWNPEHDHEDVTCCSILSLMRADPDEHGSRRWMAPFTRIRNYFGFEEHAKFWPRILFFNYLPDSIGAAESRYGNGSSEQINRARCRFLSILKDHEPDKVLVFTTKGWRDRPCKGEDLGRNGRSQQLGPRSFQRTTYEIPGKIVHAFGLRHPQGANGELMREAVKCILGLSPG